MGEEFKNCVILFYPKKIIRQVNIYIFTYIYVYIRQVAPFKIEKKIQPTMSNRRVLTKNKD